MTFGSIFESHLMAGIWCNPFKLAICMKAICMKPLNYSWAVYQLLYTHADSQYDFNNLRSPIWQGSYTCIFLNSNLPLGGGRHSQWYRTSRHLSLHQLLKGSPSKAPRRRSILLIRSRRFNLEKAPWWGGIFELMIKSSKRCLFGRPSEGIAWPMTNSSPSWQRLKLCWIPNL